MTTPFTPVSLPVGPRSWLHRRPRLALLALVLAVPLFAATFRPAHAATPSAPCAVFHCGAIAHPQVWLVYVNRPADDAITAGVRSIVEDGYFDANSAVGSGRFMDVSTVTIAPHMFGYVPYLTEPDVMPYVVQTPGNVTLFVLPDDTRSSAPDAGCSGSCLVTESYHGVSGTPGVAYAMIEGWNPQAFYNSHDGYPKDRPYQLFDVAHELIEASSDAEISDPCGFRAVPWGSYSLPTYQIGGGCTVGSVVASTGTPGADAAPA